MTLPEHLVHDHGLEELDPHETEGGMTVIHAVVHEVGGCGHTHREVKSR